MPLDLANLEALTEASLNTALPHSRIFAARPEIIC
jgi:hypothetical protein